MKTSIIVFAIFLFSVTAFGQADSKNLKPGDILTITKDANTPFEHLYFQRSNFIMKRGGLANYKALDQKKVKIEAIAQDGTAKLKPLNGKKFFNTFTYVRAHLQKALENNELEVSSISR